MQIQQQWLLLAGRRVQFLTAVSRRADIFSCVLGVKPAGGKEERMSKVSPTSLLPVCPCSRALGLRHEPEVEELTKKLEKLFFFPEFVPG